LYSVGTIGFGLLLAASVFFVVWGIGAVIRKRWRGALAALLGLGLFVTYVVLLGATAYALGASDMEGTTIDPEHKARILAEGISILMSTAVIGVPLGVVVSIVALVRGRRARRTDTDTD
jgi:hypothetical protein